MIRGVGSSRPSSAMFSSGSPTFNNYGSSPPQQAFFADDFDSLHVQIHCDDTQNRAEVRINHAIHLIELLFAPVVILP